MMQKPSNNFLKNSAGRIVKFWYSDTAGQLSKINRILVEVS